jgi:hypothetical protein
LNVTNPNYSPYGAVSFSYLNSSLGSKFPMPFNFDTGPFDAIGITGKWGGYLFEGLEKTSYPNPFNITQKNFTGIGMSHYTQSYLF